VSGAFQVRQIDHVALTVRDVDRSIAWYRDVLGLVRRHQDVWGDEPAMMCAGETGVALFPASIPNPAPIPEHHNRVVMRHLAFQVDRANFLGAQAELRGRGIPFTFEDHQISRSIYLHDPDGYEVELTTYDVDDAP
jgi:catechol 2,3-dioxygenase-like lactoylglutathione lyase family enzyme